MALVLNATRDTEIVQGLDFSNYGRRGSLWVGKDHDGRVTRALVYFPLINLPIRDNLTKATLVLSISRAAQAGFVPCRTNGPSVGCASVHVLTSPWGEGLGIINLAQMGESTWLFNERPNEWNTPGGDFEAAPIGRRQPELLGDLTATFPLNVNRMKQVLAGSVAYQGFVLMDDENPGFVGFFSKLREAPPQLVLEFGGSE